MTAQKRLKKYSSRSAARNFDVLARLSEGACPLWPVTERKRSQNPKEPLFRFFHPNGYNIFENAFKSHDNAHGKFSPQALMENAAGVHPLSPGSPLWPRCLVSL